jgi:hypothetical protein
MKVILFLSALLLSTSIALSAQTYTGKRQGQMKSEKTVKATFTCGAKRYCKQMSSCAEAKFYLEQCGLTRLDGNGDGVPCEALCR